jgi:hypothetical protein
MIETKEIVTALSDDELLPSQRVILGIPFGGFEPVGPSEISYLGVLPRDRELEFADILAYDLSLASELRDGNNPDKNPILRDLANAARNLIYNEGGSNVISVNTYDKLPGLPGDLRGALYTPQGIVKEVVGNVKQKVLEFKFAHYGKYSNREDRHIRLYTDNLAASTPQWEYTDFGSFSDIFPDPWRYGKPHFMHYPQGFENEEIALSVVEALYRILDRHDFGRIGEELED